MECNVIQPYKSRTRIYSLQFIFSHSLRWFSLVLDYKASRKDQSLSRGIFYTIYFRMLYIACSTNVNVKNTKLPFQYLLSKTKWQITFSTWMNQRGGGTGSYWKINGLTNPNAHASLNQLVSFCMFCYGEKMHYSKIWSIHPLTGFLSIPSVVMPAAP